jgi:uncharacterized protein (TIGR00369 family)
MTREKTPGERHFAMSQFFGPNVQELLQYTPHCAYLGMEAIEAGPCFATIRLPYKRDLVGDTSRGVVFGGVITTLIDHTAGLSVFCSLEAIRAIATLDLRIDYLRAADPGADLIGHAECYKMTNNVAFVRATAYETDRANPFANCVATFMLGAHNQGSGVMTAISKKGAEKPK